MESPLTYVLLGLGAGGLYALIGMALGVLHKGSGVVNLSLGAVAMLSSYTFSKIQPDLGTPLAAFLAVALCGIAGLVCYLLVMRPLRNAPPLAMLVASLGLLLLLQATAILVFDTSSAVAPTILSGKPFKILGSTVQPARVYILLIAVVLAIVLAVVYKRTAFGIYTSAAAESEKGVTLIGHSPTLIAAVNWIIGCAIAGLAGVLAVAVVGLQVENLILLVVPGLAAALFSRFKSFLLTALAGVVLGVTQSMVSGYWGQANLRDVVPFIFLLVLLLSTGEPIPQRGSLTTAIRTPEVTSARPTWSALVAAGLAVLGLVTLSNKYQSAITISMIAAIIGLSVVVLTGYVGQVSLAQLVLAGMGGFAASKFAHNFGWPFPLPLLSGALLSMAVGLLLGIPSLRIRGYSLTVLTLAAAVTVQSAVFNNINLTGSGGGSPVPAPTLGGFSLAPFEHPVRFGLFILLMLVLCGFGVSVLRNSRLGLRMLAVRDNERAAAAAGSSTARTKLTAFLISAALAGVGGALLAYEASNVVYFQFTPLASVLFIAFAYVAGIGSVSGAMLTGLSATGGLIVTAIQFALPHGEVHYWVNLVFAVLLLLTIIVHPDGVMPAYGHLRRALGRKIRRRRSGDQATGVAVSDHAAQTAIPRPAARRRTREAAPEARPILAASGLTVRFGNVVAVNDLHLDVRPGLVSGLIGPNGSGKSTFVDAVTGFVPSSGGVRFDDNDVARQPPHLRARAGVIRTFQSLELFEQLTVAENLESGLAIPTRSRSRDARQLVTERINAELRAFGLEGLREQMPRQLSTGQRRLVAVARALISRPRLVILDEPASGLDFSERDVLRQRIESLADEGASVLLIEHDVDLVFAVCDYVNVLDNGRLIASGTSAEVRVDPAVIAAYLGAAASDDTDATTLEPVT